jgi:hypothetical protein
MKAKTTAWLGAGQQEAYWLHCEIVENTRRNCRERSRSNLFTRWMDDDHSPVSSTF